MKNNSEVVLVNNDVEIRKDSVLILGLTGFGLIGPYIARILIENISDMEKIGYIVNKHLESKTLHVEGKLQLPFNLYYSYEKNLIVGLCPIKIKPEIVYFQICDTLIKWAKMKDISVKELVTFEGILDVQKTTMNQEGKIYFLSTSESGKERMQKENLKELDKGLVKGISATLLNKTLLESIQGYGIFLKVQKHPTYEGAIEVISKINNIYELDLNIERIKKGGDTYSEKLIDVFSRAKISYHPKKQNDKSKPDYFR